MKSDYIADIRICDKFLEMRKPSLKIRSVNIDDSIGGNQPVMVDLRSVYQDVEAFVERVQTPDINDVRLILIEAFLAF